MMLCKRCKLEMSSEAAALRHFAQAHPDEATPLSQHQRGEVLQAAVDGLTRQEQLLVLLLVDRLRNGGDESHRLRAKILAALVDAAELAGDADEVAALAAVGVG